MEEGNALMWRSEGYLLVKWVGNPMWKVSTGGDGIPYVEQVACIHWWPCSGMGVPT